MIAATLPFLLVVSKNSIADRLIGDISYPVYLVNILIIDTLGPMLVVDNLLKSAILVAVTLLVSTLLHRALRKPTEDILDALTNLLDSMCYVPTPRGGAFGLADRHSPIGWIGPIDRRSPSERALAMPRRPRV